MTELEEAMYNLLSVWAQYDGIYLHDGMVCFEHKNMTSTERAVDQFEKLGYGLDQGYHIALTTKGIKLYEEDIEFESYTGAEEILKNRAKYVREIYGKDIDFVGK